MSERGRASYSATGQPQWLDGVILDVTDRKVAELAIRDLAFYDPLTGLPNRRLLADRLAQQIATTGRSKRYDALLFIDMDNFKSVNDSLGHEAGDQLLIEVARRLRSNLRESDTVARLGGDEFVVILDDLASHEVQATGLRAADRRKAYQRPQPTLPTGTAVASQLLQHRHHHLQWPRGDG